MMSKASSDSYHVPVLLEEVLADLNIRADACYVDCTTGGGGHSGAILERLGSEGSLVCLDKDEEALHAAQLHFDKLNTQAHVHMIHSDYRDLDKVLDGLGIDRVDGILADLGVSSWQLDEDPRGFAFQKDGPLDMRMNRRQRLTAADLVNESSAEDLTRILRDYGEERYARLIAQAIVKRRQIQSFQGTAELAQTISHAVPAAARRDKHPAKRSFQALRIAVNDELGALELLLDLAPKRLKEGGRLLIISFHSLEDRLVKQRYREWENPCVCPRDFPVCVCGRKAWGRSVERRGRQASAEELKINPRARSARLRTFEMMKEGMEP